MQAPSGAFSNNIMRMVRRGLSVGLRTAFSEAIRRRRTVLRDIPAVHTAEGVHAVRLTVQPMPRARPRGWALHGGLRGRGPPCGEARTTARRHRRGGSCHREPGAELLSDARRSGARRPGSRGRERGAEILERGTPFDERGAPVGERGARDLEGGGPGRQPGARRATTPTSRTCSAARVSQPCSWTAPAPSAALPPPPPRSTISRRATSGVGSSTSPTACATRPPCPTSRRFRSLTARSTRRWKARRGAGSCAAPCPTAPPRGRSTAS